MENLKKHSRPSGPAVKNILHRDQAWESGEATVASWPEALHPATLCNLGNKALFCLPGVILLVEFHLDKGFFAMAMVETAILSLLILIHVRAIIMIRRWSGDIRHQNLEQDGSGNPVSSQGGMS